jgi:predicted transcriptional regulator
VDIKKQREQLRISQSYLARTSGVSRFKICLHELGDRLLTAQEETLVQAAIRREAAGLKEKIALLTEA